MGMLYWRNRKVTVWFLECSPAGFDGAYVNSNPHFPDKNAFLVPHPQHHWVACKRCKGVTLPHWDMRCLAALFSFCDWANPSKTDRYPLRFQKISWLIITDTQNSKVMRIPMSIDVYCIQMLRCIPVMAPRWIKRFESWSWGSQDLGVEVAWWWKASIWTYMDYWFGWFHLVPQFLTLWMWLNQCCCSCLCLHATQWSRYWM